MALDLSGLKLEGRSKGLDLSNLKLGIPKDREKEPETEKEPTSTVSSFLAHLAEGLVPSAATVAGAEAGVAAGEAIFPAGGGIVGGLIGGIGASLAASKAQEKVIEAVSPEASTYLKQSEKEHPYASLAGSLASFSPVTGVGVKGLKDIAKFKVGGKEVGMGKAVVGTAAIGGGMESASSAISGGEQDPFKIAMAAVASPLMLGSTKIGNKISKVASGKSVPKVEPVDILKTPDEVPHNVSTPRDLGLSLHTTTNNSLADRMVTEEYIKAAEKDGVTKEDKRAFIDHAEAVAAGATPTTTPEFKAKYDKWIAPLQKEIVDITKDMNPQLVNGVSEEFNSRIAMRKSMLKETLYGELPGQTSNKVSGGFAKTPSSEKSRTVFALEDGSIITTKRDSEGLRVTKWEDGEPTFLGYHEDIPTTKAPITDFVTGKSVQKKVPIISVESPKNVGHENLYKPSSEYMKPISDGLKGKMEVGDYFQGQKIIQAQQKNIEEHTKIKYLDDGLYVKSMLLNSLKKSKREREFLDQVVNSPTSHEYMLPTEKAELEGSDFRQLNGDAKNAFPAFRDHSFNPEYAEVLEDFSKKYKDPSMLDGVSNAIIRSMMINPVPHFMNEFVHWFDARGASGWLSPTGITSSSQGLKGLGHVADAIRSVHTQDKFQQDILRNGGFLMAPSVKQQVAHQKTMEIGTAQILKDAVLSRSLSQISKASGLSVARIMQKASDLSSIVMWSSRDMMYTHLIKEQMAMGRTIQEAISDAGKHMPEYFLPHRIAGSRKLSQAMQSPLLVFSRYHYGWMKAYGENAKELSKLGKDNAQFAKGVDHALAMALGGLIVFSGLDALYSATFGKETKARRAGAYHPIEAAVKVATGEGGYPTLLSSMVTVNPAISAAVQVAMNRDWRGKEIIPQGSGVVNSTLLAARFAGSQIKPIQSVERNVEGQGNGIEDTLAELTDAKIEKTGAAKRKAERYSRTRSKSVQTTTKGLREKYGL